MTRPGLPIPEGYFAQGQNPDALRLLFNRLHADLVAAEALLYGDAITEIVQAYDVGRWDDLRFPAQGINPPGAVNDPDRDNTTGLLLFDAGTPEVIAGVAQLPHSWKEGTAIRPHLHTRATTDPAGTGDVVWKFQYRLTNVGDPTPASYTTVQVTQTLSDYAEGLAIHDFQAFGDVDMTGKKDSCAIEWIITRVANDAADTYGHDVALIEFDIHYLANTFGSIVELPT